MHSDIFHAQTYNLTFGLFHKKESLYNMYVSLYAPLNTEVLCGISMPIIFIDQIFWNICCGTVIKNNAIGFPLVSHLKIWDK